MYVDIYTICIVDLCSEKPLHIGFPKKVESNGTETSFS